MERIRFCPIWYGVFCALFLFFPAFMPVTKTEITCRSCQQTNKWRLQELLLKMDIHDSATGSGGEVTINGDGEASFGSSVGESGEPDCAAETGDCFAAGEGKYVRSRRKRNTGRFRSNEAMAHDKLESTLSHGKVYKPKINGHEQTGVRGAHIVSTLLSPNKNSKRRVRRNTLEPHNGPNSSQPNQSERAGDQRENGTARAARRAPRSELRWNKEDRKAASARQEELKLTSSTFALTGDSAHNQAMVHWSGQNSSVILMLTKLYDFNLGSVTESSLWRSTDYGTTYEKLNEKVGVKTILSYLYVSPNNKRKPTSNLHVWEHHSKHCWKRILAWTHKAG